MVKADVEGYEPQAPSTARALLARSHAVQIELFHLTHSEHANQTVSTQRLALNPGGVAWC
jgi:hypothetical protein